MLWPRSRCNMPEHRPCDYDHRLCGRYWDGGLARREACTSKVLELCPVSPPILTNRVFISCDNNLSGPNAVPTSQASRPSATSDASSTCSAPSQTPSSDCNKLAKTYSALSNGNQTFNIECETEHYSDDLVGIYVYTFEACIEACAQYNAHIDTHPNSTCFAVTFNLGQTFDGSAGNCWLKSAQTPNKGTFITITDSAVVAGTP